MQCDQVKPVCGACTRRKHSHGCHYDESPWLNSNSAALQRNDIQNPGAPNNELASGYPDGLLELNNRIRHLEGLLSSTPAERPVRLSPSASFSNTIADSDATGRDSIDFHNDGLSAPGMAFKGPLTWMSLLRKDIFLNSLVKSMRGRRTGPSCVGDTRYQDCAKSLSKSNETDYAQLSDNTYVSIGSMTTLYLSDHKLIWLLVDRFFESELGIIYPVLQRDVFELQVSEIVGNRNTPEGGVTFSKRSHCGPVGILLLVMRLSSYTLTKPVHRAITEAESYILGHPIPAEAIKAVDRCIEENEKLTDITLSHFQLILLKRYYELISPETCNCIAVTTPGGLGQLLHHAIQCSVNRDPSKLVTNTLPANFARRLWYMVQHLDVHQLMVVGGPSLINEQVYDTDLPHLDESETPTEFAIDKLVCDFSKMTDIVYPLLSDILDVRNPPKLAQLISKLRPLEDLVDSLPSVEQILTKESSTVIQRVQKLKMTMQLIDGATFLSMVHYHIFLFYCDKMDREKSLEHLLKIIKLSSLTYPLILFFNPDKEEYDLTKHFGCPHLLIPKIETCTHRVEQMFFALIARLKIFKMIASDGDSKRIEMVDRIHDLTFASSKHVLSVYNILGDEYYHAWIVGKVHTFIISNLLKLPPGAYFAPTEADFDMLKSFKAHASDDVFFHYTVEDLVNIQTALLPFEEIDIASSITNSPLNSRAAEDNSRWMKQVIQDWAAMDQSPIDIGIIVPNRAANHSLPPLTTENVSIDDASPVGAVDSPFTLPDSLLSSFDLEQYLVKQSTGHGFDMGF